MLSAHCTALTGWLATAVASIAVTLTLALTLALTVTLTNACDLRRLAPVLCDGSEEIGILKQVDDRAECRVNRGDLAHYEEVSHERKGAALNEQLACRLRIRNSRAGCQTEGVDVETVVL